MKAIIKIGFLLLILSFLAISPARGTIHNIEIGNFYFSPAGLEINPGDTVRWTLVDGVHTTTSENDSPLQWDSGVLGIGESFDVVFNSGGEYPYLCAIHPTTMKDTITVVTDPGFTCGDVNNDLSVNLLDITYLINFLYKDGPAPDNPPAADVNGDGNVNLLDITYLINFLYKVGAAPIC